MLRLFNGRLWNARWQQTYKVYFHYVDWAPVFILFHSLITCRGQAPVTFVYLKSKCILVECIKSFVHQKNVHGIKAIIVNNVYIWKMPKEMSRTTFFQQRGNVTGIKHAPRYFVGFSNQLYFPPLTNYCFNRAPSTSGFRVLPLFQ